VKRALSQPGVRIVRDRWSIFRAGALAATASPTTPHIRRRRRSAP